MAYSVRFVKTGIEVVYKGKRYKEYTSREARSFAGLMEAKKRADEYVRHAGGIKAGWLTAKIPNTYTYGIFQLVK